MIETKRLLLRHWKSEDLIPFYNMNSHPQVCQYLPKQLTDEETKKACMEVISSTGANSLKDMGKVMGELKKKYSDNLDFSKAGSLLKELLNKQ